MADFDQIDFFTDASLLEDPYPYFEHLRSKCPVTPLPHHGVVAISGLDEASDVYRDPDTFSSCNSVIGPFAPFPVPLVGDDVSEIIDTYRDQLPMNEHMVTMDPPDHTRERALLMRLLTPLRLRENEDFMWRLADRQLDEFLDLGRCEFISAYSQAVRPAGRRRRPRRTRVRPPTVPRGVRPPERHAGRARRARSSMGLNALEWLDGYFAEYIEDRRREPRAGRADRPGARQIPRRLHAGRDVGRAERDVPVRGRAGDDGSVARHRAEVPRGVSGAPGRAARRIVSAFPNFIEEALRIESPVKADFRLARRATTIGGVDIPAGTPVMLLNGAANRDPRRFECPAEFKLDRPNTPWRTSPSDAVSTRAPVDRSPGPRAASASSASSTGCATSGSPRSTTAPPATRRFEYEPTWVLRGLRELHIEFTPTDA